MINSGHGSYRWNLGSEICSNAGQLEVRYGCDLTSDVVLETGQVSRLEAVSRQVFKCLGSVSGPYCLGLEKKVSNSFTGFDKTFNTVSITLQDC